MSLTLLSLFERDAKLMHRRLNRIVQGDCLQLMSQMPAGSVDLVVTSPPYNLLNSSGNGMKNGNGGKWSRSALMQGYATDHPRYRGDRMPHDEYAEWRRECLRAVPRVLSPGGAIFYNHKWRGAARPPPGPLRHHGWLPGAPDHHLAAFGKVQPQPGLLSADV